MSEVDELFSEAGGQPRPRRGLILALLTSGVLLATLGMACTAVPGGLIVLGAWAVADKELDRVIGGYLPADVEADVRRLRAWTLGGLGLVICLFLGQLWLLASGFYDERWYELLAWLNGETLEIPADAPPDGPVLRLMPEEPPPEPPATPPDTDTDPT